MVTISQEEFTAFAKKLDAWSATLTEKERAMLRLVVDRAAVGSGAAELSDDDLAEVVGGTGPVPTKPTFSTGIGKSALSVYTTLPGFKGPKIVSIVAPDM